ncbi:MAG: response regulator [Bacteroidia bacterium]
MKSFGGTKEMFNQQWKWAIFDEKKGLIRSAYLNLYQSKNGDYWAVSDKGILKYDHYKWNLINSYDATNRHANPGILDEDNKGNLYVCLSDTLYFITQKTTKKIILNLNGKSLLAEKVFLKSDSIYIKYKFINENIARYALIVKGKITEIWAEKITEKPFYTDLFKTKAGNIYLTIKEKIYLITGNKIKYVHAITSSPARINQISENLNGDGFITFSERPSDFRIQKVNFKKQTSEKAILLDDAYFPRSIDIFKNGNILILNRQGDTYLLDQNNQISEWKNQSSMGSRNFVYIDRNEGVWMGSFAKLNWFQTNNKFWTYTKFNFKQNNSSVKCLFLDRDSNIWTSLVWGLVKIDKYGQQTFFESANGKAFRELTAINQDENGNIWVGSGAYKNMTFSYDGKTWKEHHAKNGFTDNCVHKIEKGIDGKLYFLVFINNGFENGIGEGIFKLENGKFSKPSWQKLLKQNRFYSFLQQKDNTIWAVGTQYLVRIKNDKISEFTSENGLPIGNIYDIAEDNAGKIWFFAVPKGLYKIENERVQNLASELDQDSRRSVAEILIDQRNTIWFTGSEGLHAYHNHSMYQIDQKLGLQSQAAWPLIRINNKLFIGTNGEGINSLDLSIMDIPAPEVSISPIQVEGKEAGFVWKAITYNQTYPDEYHISYSLNDGNWSPWSSEQQVIIQGLKYGNNKLLYRVKGLFPRNEDSIYESNIKVPYPYYLQPSFYVPILLLLLALVFISIKYLINNKKNISRLKKNEKRMESYIRSMPFNSAILNEDGICLESMFTLQSSGQDFSIKEGQSLLQLFDYDKADELKNAIQRCIHLQFYETKEFTFITKHNETKYYEIRISPFEESFEYSKKVIAVFIDVTDSKLTQEELIQAKQIAEKANQAKMQFLSNMSHEIRTPMNAIIGITDMMIDDIKEPTQKENINIIKRSADHLLVIINDILDISKIESGKIDIESINFNLHDQIKQLINTLKFKAFNKGILFNYKIQENLPEFLFGDPVRLHQILINILGNALKFTEKGEVRLEVYFETKTENEVEIQFKITDTGIGIAKENQTKIFESFAQEGKNITRIFGGTGLGLSISKHLTQLLNGQISLESEKDVGSIFTVKIPFKLAKNQIDYHQKISNIKDLKNVKILIVEDNKMNQIVTNQLLKKWNASTNSAYNGSEALNILEENNFDLILMDLQMPVMDGYETTKKIKEQKKWNKIPIIALTADAFPEIKKQALEVGMDEFITKPFNQEELYQKISKLVFN